MSTLIAATSYPKEMLIFRLRSALISCVAGYYNSRSKAGLFICGCTSSICTTKHHQQQYSEQAGDQLSGYCFSSVNLCAFNMTQQKIMVLLFGGPHSSCHCHQRTFVLFRREYCYQPWLSNFIIRPKDSPGGMQPWRL